MRIFDDLYKLGGNVVMRQVYFISNHAITFKHVNDKLWNNYGYHTHLGLNDSENYDDLILKYKTLLNTIENNKIQEGDCIKFTKQSSFPKLFLKDADVGLTRTIKEDKANKVIIDKRKLLSLGELNLMTEYYVYTNIIGIGSYSWNNYCAIVKTEDFVNRGLTIEDVDQLVPGKRIGKVVTCTRTEDFINTIDLGSKISTTEQLFDYFNSKLPALDNKDMMLSMLKSSNEDQQKLAVNMIKAFNLQDCLYDVAETLGTSDNRINKSIEYSVNFKYLLGLFGETSYNTLLDAFENWRGHRSYMHNLAMFSTIYKANINRDQKLKAWFKFWQLSYGGYSGYWPIQDYDKFDFATWTQDQLPEDQREKFDLYDMPYVP